MALAGSERAQLIIADEGVRREGDVVLPQGHTRLRMGDILTLMGSQDAVGDIQDESFEVSAMNSSAKEFLNSAIADYNAFFKTNFSVDSNGFQNYYRDLSKRVKSQDIERSQKKRWKNKPI